MCSIRISAILFLVLGSLPGHGQSHSPGQSWQEVKAKKKGAITVYWYESRPFIYTDVRNRMTGIEYEILEGFKRYLNDTYYTDVQLNWKEAKNFGDTYGLIRDKPDEDGIFGVSAFSITPERENEVAFAPPYMTDITVLITSKNVPIVKSAEDFNSVFSRLTCITIRETTYEHDLLKLRDAAKLSFPVTYIPSSQNILRSVAARDDAFGYIDLPVYLMMFYEDPSIKVNRQNLFPIKRAGYSIILPRNSDWITPLREYFENVDFKPSLGKIIGHYMDKELYRFIENFAVQEQNPVELLTKEKEIQNKDLEDKARQIADDTRTRNILIALIVITLVSLAGIVLLYKKRSEQKEKIEIQRKNIELQNLQLEKRNQHLVALDEEKNNLIKILAHDLRTPINHVQGLAQVFLLSNPNLPEDQRLIIQNITDAAARLNKMITNILDIDSLESGRVKIFKDDVSLVPLLQNVIRSFEKEAFRKNISINMPSNGDFRIQGDPLFLTQVFENLVSNALKFSEKGKVVDVHVSTEPGRVRVRVTDSGPGLTTEDQHKLFKKFQRLSAKPTGGESSTGLGLSIVKKYVEMMGGTVWAESAPGKGSAFIAEFPKL